MSGAHFEHRGVVEGFYGEPFRHADRLWLIERLGDWGMNRYVYAPKDDPQNAVSFAILVSTGQLGSRPLTESTKQITPPTKSGHAPPFRGSRKNTQSVNPHPVRIW